jgi:hypothetical protein
MLSLLWVFIGFVVGLLITSVFSPPMRSEPHVPLPDSHSALYTGKGCVRFKSEEVSCTKDATPLNLVASQHK